MPGPAYDAWVERYVQRCAKPDGRCLHCGGPTNRFDPLGPIVVTCQAPDTDEIHEFCNWVCLGHWAARAAGGVLMLDEPTELDLPEDQPPLDG